MGSGLKNSKALPLPNKNRVFFYCYIGFNYLVKCGWKNICRDPSRKSPKVTEGLIADVQEGFRAGRGCVDQIFTLKEIGEKAWERKCGTYVGFTDLEKTLWQVLRIYDVGSKLLNDIKSIHVKLS